ncbi:hypothetical protein GO599_03895 [Sulfolobus islandicus]|nr:hypothetical protein [Sulfolobus islandicus]WCM36712.1 hypothetical protein GO599_03895 [Sulfolobus islandicus]
MVIISYNNTIFWVFYSIQLIGGLASIAFGRSRRPRTRLVMFSEKKIPQLILSWSYYSHELLNQYFPISCNLLSEESLNRIDKLTKGMGVLSVPIRPHGGGGGGHGGGHHGGGHGGGGGSGGGYGTFPIFIGGMRGGTRNRYISKPLLKINKDPYEAIAGFVLRFEG